MSLENRVAQLIQEIATKSTMARRVLSSTSLARTSTSLYINMPESVRTEPEAEVNIGDAIASAAGGKNPSRTEFFLGGDDDMESESDEVETQNRVTRTRKAVEAIAVAAKKDRNNSGGRLPAGDRNEEGNIANTAIVHVSGGE